MLLHYLLRPVLLLNYTDKMKLNLKIFLEINEGNLYGENLQVQSSSGIYKE